MNASSSLAPCVVSLDLGGTWIKGVAAWRNAEGGWEMGSISRRQNPLHLTSDGTEFARRITDFCLALTKGAKPCAVAAATAGEVDAPGRNYLCAGAHLGVMGAAPWVDLLAESLDCPVTLINDTEAFLLGVAGRRQLSASQNVGALVMGTGLGFAVVRQGRLWKPAARLIHFGAIGTPGGHYDQLVNFSRVTENGDLRQRMAATEEYLQDLVGVAASAVHLFHLDALVFGGGVVDALEASLDMAADLSRRMAARLLPGYKLPQILIIEESNRAILEGALALAVGHESARHLPGSSNFAQLSTESAETGPSIDQFPDAEVVRTLIREEAKAAARFEESATSLAAGAAMVAEGIRDGGRVIYVGAGTSGRIGALDAVEIPCTFGMPEDRFVAVIAGGVADAALIIEGQCEEDTSSVADLLLLNLQPHDVVVGISASGSAFFVRSALAFARMKKCRTIFVHEAEITDPVDLSIRLHSGPEKIRGSTRLKAGTATKKALNILSTTAMILLGKVREGEMIDLQCTNEKLRDRAVRILSRLSGKSPVEGLELLKDNDYQLRSALEALDDEASTELPSPVGGIPQTLPN